MQYPIIMKVLNTFKELQHQAFYFTLAERMFHRFQKCLEIMFHILHHHKNTIQVAAYHYFLYIYNRWVVE
eukprot:Gb_36480 [translate_table: standard]